MLSPRLLRLILLSSLSPSVCFDALCCSQNNIVSCSFRTRGCSCSVRLEKVAAFITAVTLRSVTLSRIQNNYKNLKHLIFLNPLLHSYVYYRVAILQYQGLNHYLKSICSATVVIPFGSLCWDRFYLYEILSLTRTNLLVQNLIFR